MRDLINGCFSLSALIHFGGSMCGRSVLFACKKGLPLFILRGSSRSLGFHGQRDDGGCEDVEISDAFLANGGS